MRNSILMTNTAAGFPHVMLGTDRAIDVGIGRAEAHAVWGRLEESRYFDTIPSNDHRLFTGLLVSFSPGFYPGLTLGAARVYYRTVPPEGLSGRDYIPFFEPPLKGELSTPENPTGDDRADQMAALYARWSLPQVGFEVYGEWARNDHNQDLKDLLAEPDHSQAYNLGFQKVDELAGGWLRVNAELIHLGQSRTSLHRADPTYYVHHIVTQGYTHEGQLLGASIGPGSDARFLRVDWFNARGSFGAWAEHVRRDEDAAYQMPARFYFTDHDVEVTAGLRAQYRFGDFDLTGGISKSSRRNRLFRFCNPTIEPGRLCQEPQYREGNWQIPISVSWTPTIGRTD
jgi:hypothetical protein